MSKTYNFTIIKKKHIVIATVLILSIAACVCVFFNYRSLVYKARGKEVIIKRNLVLPEERTIKYAMQVQHMDGHDTYLVYKFKREPTTFLAGFSQINNYPLLKTELGKEMNDIITAVKFGGWLAPSNKIPEKYLPDWNKEYYLCYDRVSSWDCCYMAYFHDSSLLIICERYYH